MTQTVESYTIDFIHEQLRLAGVPEDVYVENLENGGINLASSIPKTKSCFALYLSIAQRAKVVAYNNIARRYPITIHNWPEFTVSCKIKKLESSHSGIIKITGFTTSESHIMIPVLGSSVIEEILDSTGIDSRMRNEYYKTTEEAEQAAVDIGNEITTNVKQMLPYLISSNIFGYNMDSKLDVALTRTRALIKSPSVRKGY